MASYVYLKLQIVRAECVSAKDEKCQPFCEVNCDEESFKTCAVKDSVDPVWKETYIFGTLNDSISLPVRNISLVLLG